MTQTYYISLILEESDNEDDLEQLMRLQSEL